MPCPHKSLRKSLKDKMKKAQEEVDEVHRSLHVLDKIPKMSEHSMLRFCERILGVNTQQIYREFFPESAIKFFASNRSQNLNVLIRGVHHDYVAMIHGPYVQSVWSPEHTKEGTNLMEFSFTANEAWRRIFRRVNKWDRCLGKERKREVEK